jgi:hypothetical protein
MLLKKSFAVAILAVALQTVALADPSTLRIEQQAILIPGGVVVLVDVNCGAGESVASVVAGVRQGDFASEGSATFNATGSRQRVGVPVPGAFTTGDAVASAVLQCAALLEGTDLGETIKIVE